MSPPVLQSVLSNRKRPQFCICPVCGVEFLVQKEGQRGCTRTCAHLVRRLVVARPDASSQETKRRTAEKERS